MGKQGTLILIKTGQPPNWKEWNEMKSQEEQTIKECITMIQTEARSILDSVMGAESDLEACEILKARLPDRRHLTYWLGQIGRRKDARLGRNLDFRRYINAVVENLRSRQQEVVIVSRDQDKKLKRKIVKQANAAGRDSEKSNTDKSAKEQEEPMKHKKQLNTGGADNGSQLEPTISLSETNLAEPRVQDLETNAPTPQLSRVQDYALRNVLVFGDCCVQQDESGIFDTLARNFADKGMVSYWLNKVGYEHLTQYAKDRDLIDYIRVVSRELFKGMKKTVGKPIARW